MKYKRRVDNPETSLLLQTLHQTWSQYKKLRIEDENNVLEWGGYIEKSIETIAELGRTRDKQAVPALADMLFKGGTPGIKKAAAKALQGIKAPASIPALLKTLKNETIASVLLPVIQTLCALQAQSAVKPLLKTLRNRKLLPAIKNCAAEALGELGNENTISHLEKTMKKNPSINKKLFENSVKKIQQRVLKGRVE